MENNMEFEKTEGTSGIKENEGIEPSGKVHKKLSMGKFLGIVTAFVLVCSIVICYCAYLSTYPIPKEKIIKHRGNNIKVSVYTDDLTYKPVDLAVDIGDYIAEFSIDTTGHIVEVIDDYMDPIYGGYLCISYISETMDKYTTIVLSDTFPKKLEPLFLDDTVKNIKKPNKMIIEPKVEADGIIMEKGCINLYNRGFLCVVQQVYSDSNVETNVEEMLGLLVDSMLYSKNNSIDTTRTVKKHYVDENDESISVDEEEDYTIYPDKKFFVEFEGLGVFDLNTLPGMDGRAGVYFGTDKMLRIYKDSEEKPYAYITTLNEVILENTASTLVPAEGWNNLYYSIYKDDIDNSNYRAFAIQTSRGMYYIKVDEFAPEGFEDDLISLFGIKPDDPKITSPVDKLNEK